VINLRSSGVTPAAILGTAGFDPATVDPSTVTLAGAPVLRDRRGRCFAWLIDVNLDRRKDLLLYFDTQAFNLKVGDTEAVLTGQTFNGFSIEGKDSVTVIGPKKR
jgi:hypothetical protein